MKHKNVKVGQSVRVVASHGFSSSNKGRVGTVTTVEPLDYDGDMTVRVQFDTEGADIDWGSHKDLKRDRSIKPEDIKVGLKVCPHKKYKAQYSKPDESTISSITGTIRLDNEKHGYYTTGYFIENYKLA